MRSRSSGCRTATTGSACTSPTSRTTCSEGSALDREAYERGTSVYFPERAVHMFPSELATGLCSLNPHVDRLVQSCLMEVDAARRRGALRDARRRDPQRRAHDLHRGQRDPDRPRSGDDRAATATLVPMFELMRELFEILNARRRRRGSIDFDLPEAGGRARRGRPRRGHRRVRAQRRAPADRRVHAAGQRDGGRASRDAAACRRSTASTRRPIR